MQCQGWNPGGLHERQAHYRFLSLWSKSPNFSVIRRVNKKKKKQIGSFAEQNCVWGLDVAGAPASCEPNTQGG